MAIVAVVAVGALAFAMAAFVIGREARRLGSQPLQPVYRLTEAIDSVSADLTDEAASAIDAAVLEKIVRIHLNVLQFVDGPQPAAAGPEGPALGDADEPSVVDGDSAVQRVYRIAMHDELDVARPHIEAVLDAHVGYLEAIGALGVVDDR